LIKDSSRYDQCRDKALPYLLPILADDLDAFAAVGVIHWMGREVLAAALD